MSSSLLRQSLEFVDSEAGNRKKKRSDVKNSSTKGRKEPNKVKQSKKTQAKEKSEQERLKRNLKLLKALSEPTLDKKDTEKIIERAIRGRPLVEQAVVVEDKDEPILYTEETFKEFERKLFCS